MKSGFSKMFTAACLAAFFAVRSLAADPGPISTNADATANSYLQIQAQLHDTQMALEQSREESRQSAAEMTARIEALEQTIVARHAADLEVAQKNQQSMFMLSGAFGLTVLAAVLFMAYLQWRSVARLVEIASRQSMVLASNGAVQQLAAPGRAAVEGSNARLFGAVDHLEKRILELEQNSRAVPAKTEPANGGEAKNEPARAASSNANGHDDHVANLLADGQTLLNANEPEKALQLFDEALAVNPNHAGALVRRGGALEKLERINEAIACYDQAIEADDTLTVAYLHKGGLFNRLQRYDEALKCYESALHTQEKKPANGKAA